MNLPMRRKAVKKRGWPEKLVQSERGSLGEEGNAVDYQADHTSTIWPKRDRQKALSELVGQL